MTSSPESSQSRPEWARRDIRTLVQVLSAAIPGLIALVAMSACIYLASQGLL